MLLGRYALAAGRRRRNVRVPESDLAGVFEMSKFSEWRYLQTHGQWRSAAPDWARDGHGNTNNTFAMRAVIEELSEALFPFALEAIDWQGVGAEHLTLRQAHDETPGVEEKHPITIKHLLHAAEVLKCLP